MPWLGMRRRITNNYITTIGKGRELRFWIVPFIVLVAFLSIIVMALRVFAQAVASDDPQWAAVGVTMVAGAAYIYRFVHRALVSFNWYRGIFYGWHVNRLLNDGKGDVASSVEKSIGDLAKKTEMLHRSMMDLVQETRATSSFCYVGPSFDSLVDISTSLIGGLTVSSWLKGDLVKISPLGEGYATVIPIDPVGEKSLYDGTIRFFCKYTDEVDQAFGARTFENKVLCFDLPSLGRGKLIIVDDDSSDDRMRVIDGLVVWQDDK